MKHRLTRLSGSLIWLLIILSFVGQPQAPGQLMVTEELKESSTPSSVGPLKGALVIQGGGDILPDVWERFVSLAGGPDSHFVFIPTADDPVDPQSPSQDEFPTKRFKHITVLHTRCRMEADTEAFIAPLRTANGVWVGGGRQ
jgi:cyanophycinase